MTDELQFFPRTGGDLKSRRQILNDSTEKFNRGAFYRSNFLSDHCHLSAVLRNLRTNRVSQPRIRSAPAFADLLVHASVSSESQVAHRSIQVSSQNRHVNHAGRLATRTVGDADSIRHNRLNRAQLRCKTPFANKTRQYGDCRGLYNGPISLMMKTPSKCLAPWPLGST
jgi:hypothetical protein